MVPDIMNRNWKCSISLNGTFLFKTMNLKAYVLNPVLNPPEFSSERRPRRRCSRWLSSLTVAFQRKGNTVGSVV